jgi:hypothetical protein
MALSTFFIVSLPALLLAVENQSLAARMYAGQTISLLMISRDHTAA